LEAERRREKKEKRQRGPLGCKWAALCLHLDISPFWWSVKLARKCANKRELASRLVASVFLAPSGLSFRKLEEPSRAAPPVFRPDERVAWRPSSSRVGELELGGELGSEFSELSELGDFLAKVCSSPIGRANLPRSAGRRNEELGKPKTVAGGVALSVG